MVIEFSRHGTRAPLASYAGLGDLGVEPGSLLPEGYNEQFSIGQHINHTYPHLINPSTMSVRSSNFTRTIDSAKAQLSGIFNTTEELIPIKVKAHDSDYLLKPDTCPGIWADTHHLQN